jgi:16S rRNA (guanine527-N7)-methyltransferase
VPEKVSDTARLAAQLESGAAEMDLEVDANQIDTLVTYLELLARWNKTFNLTAVRDIHEMVSRHVLDALTVLPYLRGTRLLDVGCGAGLPGIIIATMRPDMQCTLIDSVGKKTRFCLQAVAALGLLNVEVVNARVERSSFDPLFDVVTARAFSALDNLVAIARPHLASNGRVLAMKGPKAREELALCQLGEARAHCYPVNVPNVVGIRHIVTIDGLTELPA